MREPILLVQRNADHVRQASEFANATSLEVDTSVAAVEQMRGTMGMISASPEKIVDITALIEGIAFQTNILALNAAVEARVPASERGCGFAVVAGEVCSVAQRATRAMGDVRCAIRRNQRQHLRSFGIAGQRDRASQRVGEPHRSGDPQQCWRGRAGSAGGALAGGPGRRPAACDCGLRSPRAGKRDHAVSDSLILAACEVGRLSSSHRYWSIVVWSPVFSRRCGSWCD
ncbi:hypothetical protein DF107_31875 [Burkholderia stagnalis]|nr:hypothetical protein DF161_32025 [Burkholderia stagnalis]RQQ99287.1 hypothetical protein DF031_17865 [Burkholderia stagnalis]RQX88775.1 hypothetical protein DF120_23325 [Burkholderia stagnalis]RQX90207.1 hypothetical protein DF119_29525 [Burkholderia stagnalis]RQY33418.1 hypothetical protein DF116_25340 [Burkholderia stagnalis]